MVFEYLSVGIGEFYSQLRCSSQSEMSTQNYKPCLDVLSGQEKTESTLITLIMSG